MALNLPPKATIKSDNETAKLVFDQLTSVIVGHAGATTTYRFYEEVDAWLGPWGKNGYPIGYGKAYNIKFNQNARLMADPATRRWVRKTTIYLQESMRDFIVDCVRKGTLRSLAEPQLREAAFKSHPYAYDKGGLAQVIIVSPELIPFVAAIPYVEYVPILSDNFSATLKQVVLTTGRMAPQVLKALLVAVAHPLSPGVRQASRDEDKREQSAKQGIKKELLELKSAIPQGRLDNKLYLDSLINGLNAREFPDQETARLASDVIDLAKKRQAFVRMAVHSSANQVMPGAVRIKLQKM